MLQSTADGRFELNRETPAVASYFPVGSAGARTSLNQMELDPTERMGRVVGRSKIMPAPNSELHGYDNLRWGVGTNNATKVERQG